MLGWSDVYPPRSAIHVIFMKASQYLFINRRWIFTEFTFFLTLLGKDINELNNKMENRPNDSVMFNSRDILTVAAEGGLMLLINFVAFVGNLLICLVMYNKSRFHTTTNTFMLALAMCYTFIASLVMPFTVGSLMTGKWLFGQVLCDIQAFAFLSLTWVSLLTLTVMTISRFFQVTNLAFFNKWFSLNRSCAMIMVVWIVVILTLISAEAFGTASFRFSPNDSLCSISFDVQKESGRHTTYAVVTLALYLTLPVVSLIAWSAIRRHKAYVHPSGQSIERRNDIEMRKSAEERKTNRMVLALIIGALVFWLPAVVINVLSFLIRLPRQAHLASTFFWFAVPALHPIIYGALHRPFSKEVLKVLPMSRKRQNEGHAEEAI